MATISASDGGGLTKQFGANGDGSPALPFVPHHYDPQVAVVFGSSSLVDAEAGALKVKLVVDPAAAQDTATTGPIALEYCPLLGTVAKGIIKSSAAQLLAIGVTNICAQHRYLMLFDRTSEPVAGSNPPAQPKRSYLVGPGEFLALTDLLTAGQGPGLGLKFNTGIAWAWSTAPIVYAAGAAAEVMFEARYI